MVNVPDPGPRGALVENMYVQDAGDAFRQAERYAQQAARVAAERRG